MLENINIETLKFYDSNHLQVVSVDDVEIVFEIKKIDELIKDAIPIDALTWANGFDLNVYRSDNVPIEY